jgi:hypothetical protein
MVSDREDYGENDLPPQRISLLVVAITLVSLVAIAVVTWTAILWMSGSCTKYG